MWPVDSMTTSTPRPFVTLETACTPASPPGVVTSAAQPFGKRALPCAARDADHERGTARLRKLCVKLSRDAEPHDCDGLTGRNSSAPLGVKTGGEHLNQRRRLTVDRRR